MTDTSTISYDQAVKKYQQMVTSRKESYDIDINDYLPSISEMLKEDCVWDVLDSMKENLGDKEIIVFMHYPPITKAKVISQQEAEFVELMKKYNVKRCYYGHLHGASIGDAIEDDVQGIEFKLVSADGLKFKLLKI